MKLDSIILKRFAELRKKGQIMIAARQPGMTGAFTPSPLFEGWATNALSLTQHIFGENSIQYQQLHERCQYFKDKEYTVIAEEAQAIFLAAKEDYEGGYLFSIRALVKAEVLGDELEQATALLSASYKDPAAVVTGIALETTLKELCTHHSIPHAKLNKMNADLCKAGTYNMVKQKQITAWADIRNKAAHGEWEEYDAADVKDMINGVTRFIADYL